MKLLIFPNRKPVLGPFCLWGFNTLFWSLLCQLRRCFSKKDDMKFIEIKANFSYQYIFQKLYYSVPFSCYTYIFLFIIIFSSDLCWQLWNLLKYISNIFVLFGLFYRFQEEKMKSSNCKKHCLITWRKTLRLILH